MHESSNDVNIPATPGNALDPASLGAPFAVFRPSLRSRLGIAVCVAILMVAGVSITLFLGGPGPRFMLGFVATNAVIILFVTFALGRTSVVIGPNGLIRFKGGQQDSCRWEELREIVVRVPAAGRGKVAIRRCSLFKRDGSRIDLVDVNAWHFEVMVDWLRRMSQPHPISWRDEVVGRDSSNNAVMT